MFFNLYINNLSYLYATFACIVATLILCSNKSLFIMYIKQNFIINKGKMNFMRC